VKPLLPAEQICIAIPVYDAMEANPARGIPAEQVLAALRARHAQRIIERKE
jgi:hypothetical protein